MSALDKFFLVGFCAGIPAIIFAVIQTLRQWAGIWRSGGADVIGLLLALDASIFYSSDSYRVLVKSQNLRPYLENAVVLSFFLGFFLLLVSIRYGEQELIAMESVHSPVYLHPPWPFVIVWGCATSFIFLHLLFFLGEW